MDSSAAAAAPVKKATKPRAPASHPPVAEMVNSAIKALNDRKWSSLPAIKKYVSANNRVDVAKLAPFIKKYLKTAVASGKLVQTEGTGASGSFKLSAAAKAEKPKKVAKKPVAKKVAKSPAKPKKAAVKPVAKKAAGEKKPHAAKPKKYSVKKSPAKAKKPDAKKAAPKKSPAKAKKPVAKKPASKKSPAKKAAKGAKA